MADLLDRLRSDPYLASQRVDDLQALVEAMDVEQIEAGGALVAPESAPALLLILSGEAETPGAAGAGRRLGPGTWVGELPGLEPGLPGAGATALGATEIARLSRTAYLFLREERPALRLALGLSVGAQLARSFRAVAGAIRQHLTEVRVGKEAVTEDYDVVVIGAGPHGIAYATWLKQDRPETRIAIVDKRSAPGFKIGESTLGPVVRAGMSMGVRIPVWRRLFNNKLGLHFWWMGEGSDDLELQVDHVVEETFQLERRVFELLMLEIARRAGIRIYQGARVLIEESRIHGQPKELVCETASGDVLRLRSSVLCDASGPAAVIGRHLGIRRKYRDFNTNAYFGYFRKRAEVDLATWDQAATRHLCFPEGWVWFIELASWERAADDDLTSMISHLLDVQSDHERDYPTRFELAERFQCPLDQWPVSIGVVPRTDIDSAADLPLDQRFQHYVDRYPTFKRIMDTYELIEEPYEGHPSYVTYTDLTQHSDRYAGDGWLLLGDAAFFVNPLYSPGMTYGHSVASFAARETVNALERGDFSKEAFAAHDEAARGMFSALVSECEMWYRCFRHPDAYERGLLLRVAFFIGLAHQRILQIGGVGAMRTMLPIRPPGPPGEAIMNPRYNELVRQLVDAMRELEVRGADPAETAAAARAVVDPVVRSVRELEGVAALQLGQAFQYYDDALERVPRKEPWDSLVPTWRCGRCDNRNPVEFEMCYVCGDPPPDGTRPAAALSSTPARPA